MADGGGMVIGINEREQQYVHVKSQPKNEKYANGSVGARVRLMVRGGCLSVGCSKEWNRNMMMISVCGTKETEIHVLHVCKCYDLVRRRWMRTCRDVQIGAKSREYFGLKKWLLRNIPIHLVKITSKYK